MTAPMQGVDVPESTTPTGRHQTAMGASFYVVESTRPNERFRQLASRHPG